jgi:hypothetical protein
MSRLLGGVISELVLILLNLDFEIDRSWINFGRFLNNIHIPSTTKYYLHTNSCLCWALLRDVSIWVLIFFEKWFATQIFLLASPKNIGVHTSIRSMHPPPIYPQLPHLHNHGLAMLMCLTPFQNMLPPLVYWSHLKRSFWSSDFLLKYHKNPRVLKRQSMKKKKSSKSLFK